MYQYITNRTHHNVSVFMKCSNKYDTGVTIFIDCTSDVSLCAHCSLTNLIHNRNGWEPLFILAGVPLSRNVFISNTKLVISLLGYDSKRYSGHSYRAGSATTAAMAGFSTTDIKLVGR